MHKTIGLFIYFIFFVRFLYVLQEEEKKSELGTKEREDTSWEANEGGRVVDGRLDEAGAGRKEGDF